MHALDLKIESDDFPEDLTIRGYFQMLLSTLWEEGEGFSGKRPFGNSGWEYDLYKPLIKAGVVDGELDEMGFVDDVNSRQAERMVLELIHQMCNPDA